MKAAERNSRWHRRSQLDILEVPQLVCPILMNTIDARASSPAALRIPRILDVFLLYFSGF
jgi:hypothetical protein